MSEVEMIRRHTADKVCVLDHGDNKTFRESMESDCEPAAKVKLLSSILVSLYRTGWPSSRVSLCALIIPALGLIRLTYHNASRILKYTLLSSWLLLI